MPFDSLIANPGRLRILTALANDPRQEFVQLRSMTRMTDGNLATHARRLHSAGLVDIDKAFRDGKPVTTFTLTTVGREALESHVQRLVSALQPPADPSDTPAPRDESSTASEPATFAIAQSEDDNWVD